MNTVVDEKDYEELYKPKESPVMMALRIKSAQTGIPMKKLIWGDLSDEAIEEMRKNDRREGTSDPQQQD